MRPRPRDRCAQATPGPPSWYPPATPTVAPTTEGSVPGAWSGRLVPCPAGCLRPATGPPRPFPPTVPVRPVGPAPVRLGLARLLPVLPDLEPPPAPAVRPPPSRAVRCRRRRGRPCRRRASPSHRHRVDAGRPCRLRASRSRRLPVSAGEGRLPPGRAPERVPADPPAPVHDPAPQVPDPVVEVLAGRVSAADVPPRPAVVASAVLAARVPALLAAPVAVPEPGPAVLVPDGAAPPSVAAAAHRSAGPSGG